MIRTTTIVACLLLLTIAAPVCAADEVPVAGTGKCVSINPDPMHPVDVRECSDGGQGSNNP